MIIRSFRYLRARYRYYRRCGYLPQIIRGLCKDFSIISSNCFGGRIYQDINKSYDSPTAGLFFFFDDYVEFVEKFDDYIGREIVQIKMSKWDLANKKMKDREFVYPIGQIAGTNVEIHFLHYRTWSEAKEKWSRRIQRINHDNTTFIGFYQNLPNEESAVRFLKSDKRTILFSTKEMPSYKNCLYISEFQKLQECPNPYIYARIYYKYLANYFKRQ